MEKDAGMVLNKLVTGNPLYDQELERAPWEIGSDHFVCLASPGLIEKSLEVIKDNAVLLVLTSPDGRRYGNTILVSFDPESLKIDKPDNFDEKSVEFFRIYFKDILGVWSFFQVRTISECESVLCASYPEVLYRLQRRQYQRVVVPEGTRMLFREDGLFREGGFVKDLSAGGMLICTGGPEERFGPEALLNDIKIVLPVDNSPWLEKDETRLDLPAIRQGRVVRTFCDQESNLVCHGVAFTNDAASEKELAGCIEVIKKYLPVKG